jgi:MoaA/NifB/PqqE/SkfB family radical SAM enzyme
MKWKTLTEHVLRAAFAVASRIVYRDSVHADWIYERIQRPSTCFALAMNLAYYALRVPRIFRVPMVLVEPVFGCNLRCKTCWGVNEFEGHRPPLMPWDLFCKFVDELPKSVESVTFSLWGEPLLHPRIHEMIDYVAGKGIRAILFTNGTLLKGETLERIAQSHLSVLTVSIEADNKNAGEMRGIDLDVLRGNVAAFAKVKRSDTEVKLSIVAHPGNQDKVSSVLKEWSEFAEHIKISPQIGTSKDFGEQYLCMEPWRGNLNLFTNGDVSPCCFDWNTELPIGNLYSQTLPEIIQGEAYHSLLRRFLAGQVPNKCLKCKEFTVEGAPLRLHKRKNRRS